MLILFFGKDKESMELALEQNNIIPKENVNNIINDLKNNKGSKLEHLFEYIIL